MSATLITRKQMSFEEYLEFDKNAEGRFEYFDGEIFELSGGSPEHAIISTNVSYILSSQLRARGCSVYSSDIRIKVPKTPTYRYADVTSLCEKPIYEDIWGVKCLTNPSLIVEILSDSTEAFDRGDKFSEYKSIESFTEYLLISQRRKLVTKYSKYNEKFWMQSEYETGEILTIESLNCELSVNDIYQGIEFITTGETN